MDDLDLRERGDPILEALQALEWSHVERLANLAEIHPVVVERGFGSMDVEPLFVDMG
jgi:hypothetical protein